ncbi:hypothetical protein RD055328_12320 [Companilactobacillus sp. RD055328]|uniref:WxL domain-containing protein n=1 Tax=Companilactobacillus sp. RD055328 TaxID=2916634 RepID=UPI001FC8B7A1|nr:WxL domain-containing protein [Companilactobacillus sp. RD055328]GKQ43309.1 hypothetical protein RD055328_12320 [Companilactobacillus sp. RD055328]
MKRKIIGALLLGIVTSSIGSVNIANAADDLTTKADVQVNADPNGTLSITSITPVIKFNDLTLDSSKATTTTIQNGDFIASIMDARGTGAGWNLAVRYSAEDGSELAPTDEAWTDTTVSGRHLKGAKLKFVMDNGLLSHDGDENPSTDDKPSFGNTEITISNSDMTYLNAAQGQGLGEWTHTIHNASDLPSVTLEVPSTTTLAGSYSANLTWTLTDVPK